MPRRKFRYQMYQPHNVEPISTENNKYLIHYEETRWILDTGPSGWSPSEESLELQSNNIDEEIRELNHKTVKYIIEDYKEVNKEIIIANMVNQSSASMLKERAQWLYEKWKEFKTLFDTEGWVFNMDLPGIFRFQPNDNYTIIAFGEQVIYLSPSQGMVIMILHKSYLNGIYSRSTKEIFDEIADINVELEATKLSQVFDKKRKERNILIKEVRKGVYSLNMPPIN